jgi:pyruvate dehydrogenase E2 component (dihydrolipoamide acetyltransferase)
MVEFRMPSLGSDMERGTLVEWLKKPGETVRPGDIVAVIETDKGAIEIEAFEGGIFVRSLVELGQTVPVGAPIALIETQAVAELPTPTAARSVRPSPRAPAAPAVWSPPPARGAKLKVSPAARKFAAERGLDLGRVAASGPEGSIVLADVEAAASGKRRAEAAASAEERTFGPDLGAMQSVIAAATSRAKREIPHYYLTHEVDVTGALKWLAKTNAKRTPGKRLLPVVLFLKSLALTLRKHPSFNGFYDGGFRPSERIHVGIAVATRGGGLIAPALHDTDRLSLDELMVRLRDLVARVRAARFRSSEISDPTVTLTSLGERGVDTVIPVIYPPQVAILGVGTPRARPWVVGGKVKPRDIVSLSLAGDHRVGNGHRGALFLADWANLMQHPEAL